MSLDEFKDTEYSFRQVIPVGESGSRIRMTIDPKREMVKALFEKFKSDHPEAVRPVYPILDFLDRLMGRITRRPQIRIYSDGEISYDGMKEVGSEIGDDGSVTIEWEGK